MTREPGPGETLDELAGGWSIFQLRRGHRYATDDVLTAWTAARARPGAERALDLGSGVGSIGLMTLQRLGPGALLVAVEVQPESVALARRTVEYNGLEGRVELRLADLRDEGAFREGERFDLITANPPFLPPGRGWISPHPQRGAARFELHGDVGDYCRVAAERLLPGGRFVLCHAAADPRPERALAAAGLAVLARQDVIFRRGRPPQIALFTSAAEGERRDLPPLCVRDERGQRTAEYLEVLREMAIVE